MAKSRKCLLRYKSVYRLKYLIFIFLFNLNLSIGQTDGLLRAIELRKLGNACENSDSAIDYFNQSYQWFVSSGMVPHEDAAACLNNIGLEYAVLKKFDLSEKYYRECLTMYAQLNSLRSKHRFIGSLSNFALMFNDAGNLDSAEYYFKLSFEKSHETKEMGAEELDRIYSNLLDFYSYNERWDDESEIRKRHFLGAKAIDFDLLNRFGKTVNFTDFKGDWVLLDFWASWCYPCLKEIPTLKYVDTAFPQIKIVSISVDEDLNSWTDQIENFQLTWEQLIDHNDSRVSIASKYGASRIPLTVLIDSEGIIRAYGLRGDELISKIETLEFSQ